MKFYIIINEEQLMEKINKNIKFMYMINKIFKFMLYKNVQL